jgi:hypothetical protein
VGDPEVVYIESLGWKEVWIKVASKEPRSIKGTSEVYINKIGCLIIWEAVDPKISSPPGVKMTRMKRRRSSLTKKTLIHRITLGGW